MGTKHLNDRKKMPDDEYYTQLSDIVDELSYYKEQFKNKSVLLPCDIREVSSFSIFFEAVKEEWGIKDIVYSNHIKYEEIIPEFVAEHPDGIVVTNPPFSSIRHFYDLIKSYNLKFLIIVPLLFFGNEAVFKDFKDGIIWKGYNHVTKFITPENITKTVSCHWATNLEVDHRILINSRNKRNFTLTKTYDPVLYPKCDGSDIICVDRLKDIPYDYEGFMGVPVTFLLYYHNLFSKNYDLVQIKRNFKINGKGKFMRVIIKKKQKEL